MSGQGRLAPGAVAQRSSIAGRPTGFPSSSVPAAPPVATAGLLRPTTRTRIGDPATADLCSTVGYDAFDNVQGSPEDADRQYLPGCQLTVSAAAGTVDVVAWVGDQRALTTKGRTVRRLSGFPVYAYPYANDGDECPRYVLAGSFQVEIRVFADGDASRPGKALACGVTDDMTRAMAAAVRAGKVPRLALPAPSITRFDACKVARAARVTSAVDGLAGARFTRRQLGEQCTISVSGFDVVVSTARDWSNGRPEDVSDATVGGHPIFVLGDLSPGSECGYISSQDDVGGKYEEVVVLAIADDGNMLPQDACTSAEQVLSRYLDTAGLH